MIQSAVRRWFAQVFLCRARSAAVLFQAAWRGCLARAEFSELRSARDASRRQTCAAVCIQSRFRGQQARRRFIDVRREARQSENLLRDKAGLEQALQETKATLTQVIGQRDALRQILRERDAALERSQGEAAAREAQAMAASAAAADSLREAADRIKAADSAAITARAEVVAANAQATMAGEMAERQRIELEDVRNRHEEAKCRFLRYRAERDEVRASELALREEVADLRAQLAARSEHAGPGMIDAWADDGRAPVSWGAVASRGAVVDHPPSWGPAEQTVAVETVRFLQTDRSFIGDTCTPTSALVVLRAALVTGALAHEVAPLFPDVMEAADFALAADWNAGGEHLTEKLAYWAVWGTAMLALVEATAAPDTRSSIRPPILNAARGAASAAFGFLRHLGSSTSPGKSASRGNEPAQADGTLLRLVPSRLHTIQFRQALRAFVCRACDRLGDAAREDLADALGRAKSASQRSAGGLGPEALAPYADIAAALERSALGMEASRMPPALLARVIEGVVAHVDADLFNAMLIHRRLCSFHAGHRAVEGLAQLETWLGRRGLPVKPLRHVKQSATFLVTNPKSRLDIYMVKEMLADLSLTQVLRLCNSYHDEEFQTPTVTADVLREVKAGARDATFLLSLDDGRREGALGGSGDALRLVRLPEDPWAALPAVPHGLPEDGSFAFLTERPASAEVSGGSGVARAFNGDYSGRR